MGKATILPSGARNLPSGQYRVRLEKSDTRSEQELKRIDLEISALDVALPGIYTDYNDSRKVYGSAKSDLDEIIQQSKESPEVGLSSKVTSATASERSAYGNLASTKSRYQAARLKQRALQGKKLYIGDNITEDIRTVWCADCQKNLSGEIATIEIPNTDDTVLIRPGGADGSGSNYSAARDGQLRSVAAMSPAEAAWNYMMLPGWQKFKPLYRIGKVTSRAPNSSKCSVLLDAQSEDIDIERQLNHVPMIYKSRDDGGPYQIGDRVVIEFYNQNWEAPRVVGFEDYPCTTTSTTTTSISVSTSSSVTTTTLPLSLIFMKLNGAYVERELLTGDVIYTSDPGWCPGWPYPCFHTRSCITDIGLMSKLANPGTPGDHDYFLQYTGISVSLHSYFETIGPGTGFPFPNRSGCYGLDYDIDSEDLVSIFISDNAHPASSRYIVLHNGVSNTVSSYFQLTHDGNIVVLSGITIVNGDVVVAGYFRPPPGYEYNYGFWVLDGKTSTIKSYVPISYTTTLAALATWDSNLIIYFRNQSGSPLVVYDGVSSDILFEYNLNTTYTSVSLKREL